MLPIKIKKTAILTLLGLSLSGCIGQMATSGVVGKFNLEVSENAWVQEGVFLLLLPVQGFAATLDLLVVNSIEFWTGTNPVSKKARISGDPARVFASNITVNNFNDSELNVTVTNESGNKEPFKVIRSGDDVEIFNRYNHKVAMWIAQPR